MRVSLLLSACAIVATSASAQQTARGLFVMHKDARDEPLVRLLDDTAKATNSAGRRVASGLATRCSSSRRSDGGGLQPKPVSLPGSRASVGVPESWELRIPGPISLRAGERLGETMLLGSVEKTGDAQTKAFIYLDSEEGFPQVVLTADTKASSMGECRTTLSSAQIAYAIEARASGSGGENLHYVLGYAPIGKGRWLSFLGMAANAADVATLHEVFRSVTVR